MRPEILQDYISATLRRRLDRCVRHGPSASLFSTSIVGDSRGDQEHFSEILPVIFEEVRGAAGECFQLVVSCPSAERPSGASIAHELLSNWAAEFTTLGMNYVTGTWSRYVNPPPLNLQPMATRFLRDVAAFLELYKDEAVEGRVPGERKEVPAVSTKQVTIHVGNGATFTGDVITAETIDRSFTAARTERDDGLRAALEDLVNKAAPLLAALPAPTQQETARCLETLVAESRKDKPSKRWYEVSADGLLEAAKTMGELAGPVAAAVNTVLDLLRLRATN